MRGVILYPVLVVLFLLFAIGIGVSSLVLFELRSSQGLPGSHQAFSAAEAGIERMARLDSCIPITDQSDRLSCLQTYTGVSPIPFAWKCHNAGFDYPVCLKSAVAAISPGSLASGAAYTLELDEQGENACSAPFCFFATGTFEGARRKIELRRQSASLLPCGEKIDVMLVVDNSSSIGASEFGQMRDATQNFVDLLDPTPANTHVGLVRFSGDLDYSFAAELSVPLGWDKNALKEKLEWPPYGYSRTNIEQGLLKARESLTFPYDRLDTVAPDYLILISDGDATLYGDPSTDFGCPSACKAATEDMADSVKADGITIFALGVGISPTFVDFLQNKIVSSPAHYFNVADFGDLEDELENLCP